VKKPAEVLTTGINLKSKLPVPLPVTSGYTISELAVSFTVAIQLAAKAPTPNIVTMLTVNVVCPPESTPPVKAIFLA